jgi:hypothetical protein
MPPKTEITHPYKIHKIHPTTTAISLVARFKIALAHRVQDERGFHICEDHVVIRRWRLGFFVFYSVFIFLLVGFATVTDRPRTLTSTATQTNPATASADFVRHSAAEGAMRE